MELRPKALDDFGLHAALERLIQNIGDRGLQIDLVDQLADERLPEETETVLYRIVQEALTNVLKHADATRVSIVLARRPDGVAAMIEDDGRGFDTAAGDGGIGLIGMRERLSLVDGHLTVESAPGRGTTIVAKVPV